MQTEAKKVVLCFKIATTSFIKKTVNKLQLRSIDFGIFQNRAPFYSISLRLFSLQVNIESFGFWYLKELSIVL